MLNMFMIGSLILFLIVPGCADSQKTTRTQERAVVQNYDRPAQAPAQSVTTETQTTTTEAKSQDSPGLVGGFFHVVGTILAFPFKVIAKVLETIF